MDRDNNSPAQASADKGGSTNVEEPIVSVALGPDPESKQRLKGDMQAAVRIKDEITEKIRSLDSDPNADELEKRAYKLNLERACNLIEEAEVFLRAIEYDRILNNRQLSLNNQILDVKKKTQRSAKNNAILENANQRTRIKIMNVSEELENCTFINEINKSDVVDSSSNVQSQAQPRDSTEVMIDEITDDEGIKDPRIVCVKSLVEVMLGKQQTSLAKQVCLKSVSEYRSGTIEHAALKNLLGVVCASESDVDEAFKHYSYAIDVYTKFANRAGIAAVATRLSTLYYNAKLYDKSSEYNEMAIALRKKEYGEKHVLVAKEINVKAIILYRKGQHDDAIAVSKECLQMYQAVYENDNPVILKLKTDQARMCIKCGNYNHAEKLLNEVVPIYQRMLLGIETLETSIVDAARRLEDKDNHGHGSPTPSMYHVKFDNVANSENAFKALADLYEKTARKEAHNLVIGCLSRIKFTDATLTIN